MKTVVLFADRRIVAMMTDVRTESGSAAETRVLDMRWRIMLFIFLLFLLLWAELSNKSLAALMLIYWFNQETFVILLFIFIAFTHKSHLTNSSLTQRKRLLCYSVSFFLFFQDGHTAFLHPPCWILHRQTAQGQPRGPGGVLAPDQHYITKSIHSPALTHTWTLVTSHSQSTGFKMTWVHPLQL